MNQEGVEYYLQTDDPKTEGETINIILLALTNSL